MSSRSEPSKRRSQSGLETSCTSDGGTESTGNTQPRDDSTTSPSSTLIENVTTPSASDLPDSAMNMDENEETIITSIKAADVTLGLRRLPAGFYVVVLHSGLEWRTENKRCSVNHDVVEWSRPIPIPTALSSTIRLEVYASFEFQPILGAGEQLRRLTMSVEQLLGRSEKGIPFRLFPKDGDVVSPCSSILITVRRRKFKNNDSPTLTVLDPQNPTTGPGGELEDATNRGHNALLRYKKHGVKRDLEYSIEEFKRALGVCPLDHPCRAAAQSNLAMARFIHCRVEDTDTLLPLGLYRDALSARLIGHMDRPATLIQLAAVHFARSEKWRDQVEESRVETLLREAMELSPTKSHENRAAALMLQLHAGRKADSMRSDDQSSVQRDTISRMTSGDLHNLSLRLLDRFERFGHLTDLQQAIALLKGFIRSTSVWDAWYPAALENLAGGLLRRFQHLGELSDLEDAISTLKDTSKFTPRGHPDSHNHLNNLAVCLKNRFQHLGELSDINDAISMLTDAVSLTPHSHPQKPMYIDNLGGSFFTRYQQLGELSDLEAAISRHRSAIDLAPSNHPDKPRYLSNLGNSIAIRFERLGELGDLEEAISRQKDAIDLTPHSHPEKPSRLNSFGNCLCTRFRRLGELTDLEDSISALLGAVRLTPYGHSHKPAFLHNLSISFLTRFERLGEPSDLESAILTVKNAVDLTPRRHPHKPVYVNSLGNSFRARFERFGGLSDLEDAISMFRDVVELTPYGHPARSNHLSNLGNSLVTRFKRLGELSDLEDAISTQRDAAGLTPYDHPEKLGRLSDLGSSLITRFERLGELTDLEDAIAMLKDAVGFLPHGHSYKPTILNNLGNCFLIRFEHLGNLSDLEHAISRQRDAVDSTPHGHPRRRNCLSNLGCSLRTRFERLGELNDLENAILTLRDAVGLMPNDHPDNLVCLHNLGNAFLIRFERLGELSDLEHAISTQRHAIDLAPHGHPDKLVCLISLGNSFVSRFRRLGEPGDLEHAIYLYFRVASASFGSVGVRFRAARQWISCARRIRHRTLLLAYTVTINLLPQLAWIGLPLTNRYSELTQGANVVREAAAAALDWGLPETAVEWLEQGRSIVWGELLQLRNSHEELSSAYPEHARRLRELSGELEHASATREKSLSALSEQTQSVTESLEQEAVRHRALALQRDKLLHEIRRLPGFERFLLHKGFSHLRGATHAGPVVILNAAKSRCDALIVLANVDHVIHVPLPFTFEQSVHLQDTLKGFVRHAREGKKVVWDGVTWESFLSPLWRCVVKPVLDALAFSTSGNPSRIFWCPTGPFAFLPIHAAGFYDAPYSQPGHKVFDFVVSSYVPTLNILALSSKPNTRLSDLRLLAVHQPPSDGLSWLPGVNTELEHIKEVTRDSPSARAIFLESSIGTVEEVLALMKEADWVHFACHGIQDGVDSGLCLADRRRLKLRDIVALSRPRGGLAFLSACQTATGEENLSDEAIHMTAGMLFSGYGGVIGTMWSISDKLAPDVARDVYEYLFRSGTRPDYREAAYALHEAIGCIRNTGSASFDEWVPFIHVGL